MATASFGNTSSSTGAASIAAGNNTAASGDISVAFGERTSAKSAGSFAIGRYNKDVGNSTEWINTDPLFTIGNGYLQVFNNTAT